MIIYLDRGGVKDVDRPVALWYYGRYKVGSWGELFYAAVKALYMEYPDVINSLVSKDSSRPLYLRTTTIDMKEPRQLDVILYMDTARKPTEITQALRQVFSKAGVLNIQMAIEIADVDLPAQEELTTEEGVAPKIQAADLEVPSFMASESIIDISFKTRYIAKLKELVASDYRSMKRCVGHMNKHRLTLSQGDYIYFRESVFIGAGLYAEAAFSESEMEENMRYFQKECKQ